MTSKNETQAWIKRKGHEKFAETAPERFVAELLKEIQTEFPMLFYQGKEDAPLNVNVGEWTFHPDFICHSPFFVDHLPKAVEVDGVFHKDDKDEWHNKLYVANGHNVVRIPYPICVSKYRDYAKAKLKAALLSTDGVVVIPA